MLAFSIAFCTSSTPMPAWASRTGSASNTNSRWSPLCTLTKNVSVRRAKRGLSCVSAHSARRARAIGSDASRGVQRGLQSGGDEQSEQNEQRPPVRVGERDEPHVSTFPPRRARGGRVEGGG